MLSSCFSWCRLQDLNLRPPDYKSATALTSSMAVLTFSSALFRCFRINNLTMVSESVAAIVNCRTATAKLTAQICRHRRRRFDP